EAVDESVLQDFAVFQSRCVHAPSGQAIVRVPRVSTSRQTAPNRGISQRMAAGIVPGNGVWVSVVALELLNDAVFDDIVRAVGRLADDVKRVESYGERLLPIGQR